MTRIKNKILPITIFCIIVTAPILACADIMPNCGQIVNGKLDECNYEDFMMLINNILKWIVMISVPVATGVIAWAGFLYMTTGISDKKSKAKSIIQKVFLGFVFILAAWIIVGTVVKTLLKDPGSVPINISM